MEPSAQTKRPDAYPTLWMGGDRGTLAPMHSFLPLAGAGLLAGAMNALAGGGSFVTLTALVSVGLPSVAANASSTVALYPAGAMSAWRAYLVLPVRPRVWTAKQSILHSHEVMVASTSACRRELDTGRRSG